MKFDGTIGSLIECYRGDEVSPYQEIRHATRTTYDTRLRRIANDYGDVRIDSIKFRTIKEWHKRWSHNGAKPTIAHGMIVMLRILMGYGIAYQEDDDCARVSAVLSQTKFQQGKPREHHLSGEHVIAIRAGAHKIGRPSIALAQAIQFECTFRQKDCVGEWVPVSERGVSDIVTLRHGKWLRGVRWNEIDDNMILRHVTSKKQKEAVIDLTAAPMVLEELRLRFCELGEPLTRARLPASGPIIVDEKTGRPYLKHQFARIWRSIANDVGVPKHIRNMDSRAGAITEATAAGVPLDDVRKAATHSQVSMTARYSRDEAEATKRTMQARAAARDRA